MKERACLDCKLARFCTNSKDQSLNQTLIILSELRYYNYKPYIIEVSRVVRIFEDIVSSYSRLREIAHD
ncbi:hypothetical protein EYC80_008105 [Monilinia laxa]|uniref:Uncharacterized protein n=1 Tax=Monilinia laxa TaxID=61186 RepID=A0A5N6JTG9_MONLA|nr:hypothetical protein EYC80_008105 [Monilinia laxa]